METIKVLRKKLDGFSQVVERLKPIKTFGTSAAFSDIESDKKIFEVSGFPEQVNSDEIETCRKNLLLAKAWTGKMIGFLGEPTPYKNDGTRTDVGHIEPTDAKVDIDAWEKRNNWNTLNHIQKVDFVRESLQPLINEISGFFPPMEISNKGEERHNEIIARNRSLNIARTAIFEHLVEARFQMGFELERIKREEGKPDKDVETMYYGGVKQK